MLLMDWVDGNEEALQLMQFLLLLLVRDALCKLLATWFRKEKLLFSFKLLWNVAYYFFSLDTMTYFHMPNNFIDNASLAASLSLAAPPH